MDAILMDAISRLFQTNLFDTKFGLVYLMSCQLLMGYLKMEFDSFVNV